MSRTRIDVKRQYRKMSTGYLYGLMAAYLVEENDAMLEDIQKELMARGALARTGILTARGQHAAS